ncbi:insulinase family protein [Candidatus Azambacteria bacterium]|nr:insulinase family protein [Candidatus Azambacteria bacterium]
MKNKLTYRKTTLENGLRIITIPMRNTSTVASMVFVKTGSRYEQKKENGISHVLEHMFFEGTKKRPSSMSVNRELDRVGAVKNAYTSNDHTAYYVKTDAKHFDLGLDVLSDMYLHSLFRPASIEKERRVVVEEIRMYKDTPQRQVWDNFSQLLYPDNSLGRSVLGPESTVLSLTRANLLSYLKEFYVAQNTTVVIAGNIDEHAAIAKVKRYFKTIRTGKPSVFSPVGGRQEKPRVHVEYKKIDQAHLVLGAQGYAIGDKRRHALEVLEAILGGYFSSRLMTSVRDTLGLAYYVGADADHHEDTGSFSAYAGINLAKVELGITAILKEFEKVRTRVVPKKEIDDAKTHIEGALSLQLELSNSVALGAGWSEVLSGRIETPKEYMRKIKAVTAADIRAVANDVLRPQSMNLAIIGPFKEKDIKRFQALLHI